MGPGLMFQAPAPNQDICTFLTPAPTSGKFWLRLQNDWVHWKPKIIVLFVQLAWATNYDYGTGIQIPNPGFTI